MHSGELRLNKLSVDGKPDEETSTYKNMNYRASEVVGATRMERACDTKIRPLDT